VHEAARLVRPLLEEVLRRGLPPWHVVNVNLPDAPAAEVRGIRLTRHGVSGFDEWYRELAAPSGDTVRRFQLEGEMRLRECDGTTDAEALGRGWISVTPMALDLAAGAFATAKEDVPEARAGRWDWLAEVPLGRGAEQ
jgi:5'-nucleotidase